MTSSFAVDDSAKFVSKINGLVTEIKTVKQSLIDKSQISLWKSDYDNINEKLLDILDLAAGNVISAKSDFEQLPLSKYETFASYMYNTDISMISLKKGSNERTKMIRAKRKDISCPDCGKPLTIISGKKSCASCGYINETKAQSQSNRSSSDSSKHTTKQLDAITGTKKPPANIQSIVSHISIWLTDLKYIHAWLVANDKLKKWMHSYKDITADHITESFFMRTIDRVPSKFWDCDVFKLFTDELYTLLEMAKRYSRLTSSTMEALDNDEIKDIFREYAKQHSRKVPDVKDVITINGVSYDIGLYTAMLSLKAKPPAGSVKIELEKILGRAITIPGLMFNFTESYKQSDNVPKRYNFTQEYIYITHETFGVPYIAIDAQDKAAIAQLILSFNDYYKQSSYNTNGKECNAPLFCCSLTCVLQMPYFKKYIDALKFVPEKDRGTASHIKMEWFKYSHAHASELAKYTKHGSMMISGKSSVSDTPKTVPITSDDCDAITFGKSDAITSGKSDAITFKYDANIDDEPSDDLQPDLRDDAIIDDSDDMLF